MNLSDCQAHLANLLVQYLPPLTPHLDLVKAVHYACLNGGKRLRPLLVYATGHMFDTPTHLLDPLAVAIEVIHCYSLVHDDLPAMDDDDLRRGKPTCHKVFGEAVAILAGDGLLTLAFEIIANDHHFNLPKAQHLQLIKLIAQAAGLNGMVYGQALDLQGLGDNFTLEALIDLHCAKTGALLKACIVGAAIVSQQTDLQLLDNLSDFGQAIGLAYQIQDDILDATSDIQILGKTPGKDSRDDKCTFVSLLGVDGAKRQAIIYYERALNSLASLGELAQPLRHLAAYIIDRVK